MLMVAFWLTLGSNLNKKQNVDILKGISKIISPKLLKALMEMGAR